MGQFAFNLYATPFGSNVNFEHIRPLWVYGTNYDGKTFIEFLL